MIRETELNLLVPSPELLVRLASGDKPLGVRAGPPHIRMIRETYFDTPEEALRRRGMTCKLRQEEGGATSVVVTVGEGPDSEGITSRSRLSASAVGMGFYETLRADSEAAAQIRKLVQPTDLRPVIALDIQRLSRVHRHGLLRRPTLTLNFDRITVQVRGKSAVFHEVRIRRRRKGGPLIRELAQCLRDEHHLFPDGLSTLQRAYRIHHTEAVTGSPGHSPYSVSLSLAMFKDGKLALQERNGERCIPTFRGSGEDAARALCADLTGRADQALVRLGTTEPKEGRETVELWVASEPEFEEGRENGGKLVWYPWHQLVESVGTPSLRQPTFVSAMLLLTRGRLLGRLRWIPDFDAVRAPPQPDSEAEPGPEDVPGQLRVMDNLTALLRKVEDGREAIPDRLRAASDLSDALRRVFQGEVRSCKEQILSGDGEEDEGYVQLLDILAIRIRGVTDRLYRCLNQELLPGLEKAGIHLRSWSGIPHEDRRAFLALFTDGHLQELQGAKEWGPAFIPDMPPEGSAVGLLAPAAGTEGTRFFHLVLHPETPSFLSLPETSVALPLEEVVRGHLFSLHPELERSDTFLFRFMTGEVAGRTQESRETIVIRVLARQRTPETQQAQLLRALERQVSRRNPLIGWADLYPVRGPLDLSGIHRLLDLIPD